MKESEKIIVYKWYPFWKNIIVFGGVHLGAVYTIFAVLPSSKHLSVIYSFFLACFSMEGITMGAHRLWSHRAFKTNRPVKLILLLAQTIAGQGSVIEWSRDHRIHHRFTDTDADPYNAKRGMFFSHIGWLLTKRHPENVEKRKTIDVDDLLMDPFLYYQDKFYSLLFLLFAVILPIIPPMIFWEETLRDSFFICFTLRYAYSSNCTFLVNSYAHMFGMKPFNKNISAVETQLVSWLALGEGWHNYHHSFPWDWRAAELNGGINMTTSLLKVLATLGLVWDMKSASDQLVISTARERGDGSFGSLNHAD